MTSDDLARPKPLRLWPGALAALLIVLARFGLPFVMPEAAMASMMGGIVGALAIVVWWLLLSRAPWVERIGAIALMVLGLLATSNFVHESISTGMMGMMLFILGVQVVSFALAASALVTGRLSAGTRRAAMALAILVACGYFALLRTGGITGAGDSDLHWRWTPSPEEKLLASANDTPAAVPASQPAAAVEQPPIDLADDGPSAPNSEAEARSAEKSSEVATAAISLGPEWPGFRGAGRDSIVRGVRIQTDWSTSPPVQMWRRPIGPGWSSFAVRGDLLYTQEQRGDEEIVACYRVSTGEPVWWHRDPARFWESNGGAGPRATPTLSNGRVYSFGATGILNALDAATGAVVWSRNVAEETNTQVPDWGFSSSPLVIDDLVVVAADATLVAYDLATGRRRWVGPVQRGSYSSPHRASIKGVEQIVLLGGNGATSVAPSNGAMLWEHSWPGMTIIQPAVTAEGDVLINASGAAGAAGTRRVAVTHGPGGWSTEERWTSNGLKPFFNDFVIHKGHAFGFDGSILASIDLTDGRRTWKGGRYGSGQLVLLFDQDLLLVLAEEGDLALVSATPDQFKEIARVPAIDGKTWNHPVVVGDILLVRNGEEMAAYRLPSAR
jgi:outer membrane protein assembly factor BamB